MTHDWQQISDEHGSLVWKTVFRLLRNHAESLDCYQDVMLEAFQYSRSNEIKNLPGYLRWLSVRRGLDRIRQRQRSIRLIDSNHDVVHASSKDAPIECSIEMQELKSRLRNELSALPEQQAQAFWLRFIEQMSYEEIATQMNVEPNAVGVWIHRARLRVQETLSDLQPAHRQDS